MGNGSAPATAQFSRSHRRGPASTCTLKLVHRGAGASGPAAGGGGWLSAMGSASASAARGARGARGAQGTWGARGGVGRGRGRHGQLRVPPLPQQNGSRRRRCQPSPPPSPPSTPPAVASRTTGNDANGSTDEDYVRESVIKRVWRHEVLGEYYAGDERKIDGVRRLIPRRLRGVNHGAWKLGGVGGFTHEVRDPATINNPPERPQSSNATSRSTSWYGPRRCSTRPLSNSARAPSAGRTATPKTQ